jgi:hypothetical protein
MSSIQTTSSPILAKSPGTASPEIGRVRTAKSLDRASPANAEMGENIQRQINAIVNALQAPVPQLETLQVTAPDGTLLGWIGTFSDNTGSYAGAWFKQLYIGGTSAADAAIVADSSGNVTIRDAEIVITGGGVQTTINNILDPVTGLTESIQSLDITIPTGGYSFLSPYSFQMMAFNATTVSYQPGIEINNTNASGGGADIIISDAPSGGTKEIQLATGGGGTPFIIVTDGTNTSRLTQAELTTGIVNATAAFQANGVAGSSTTIAYGSSITSSAALVLDGIFPVTASDAVFGTPGTGQSNGTVLTSISVSSHLAANAAISLNTTPASFSLGLLI